MLIVERRQILPVLEHQRALVTALLVGIHIVVVLVLNLLMLLLQLSLVLLHLLSAAGVVSHVVQVHLLLNVDIVFRGGTLLLGLHHHLVASNGLIWIDSVWVAVLHMLPTHRLIAVIHQQMSLVMLPVLLVAARVRILTGAVAQRRHYDVLHVVVDRKINRRLLHLGLLLRAAAGQANALLAIRLMRQYRVGLIVLRMMRIDV